MQKKHVDDSKEIRNSYLFTERTLQENLELKKGNLRTRLLTIQQ